MSRRDLRFWALVVVVGGALVFGSIPGEPDRGRTPERSSLEVSEKGYAGWRLLLGEQGIEVDRLDETPSEADLDPDQTVIGLDLGSLTDRDSEALADFVERGGRLVAGGDTTAATLDRLSGVSLAREEVAGPGAGEALVPAEAIAGVSTIAGEDSSRYADPGGGLPLFGSDDGALLVELGRGEGEVVAIADSSPLSNGRLDSADNAQLAVSLAGGGAGDGGVLFLERLAIGGEETATGIAALPDGWIAGFIGLVFAALVLIGSRLRRLGPPDQPPGTRAEPRIGYVDAMARGLARGKEATGAAEPVRAAARAAVLGRAEQGEGDDADMLARRAERAGVPAEEAEALARPLEGPSDAVKVTRALSRVWRER